MNESRLLDNLSFSLTPPAIDYENTDSSLMESLETPNFQKETAAITFYKFHHVSKLLRNWVLYYRMTKHLKICEISCIRLRISFIQRNSYYRFIRRYRIAIKFKEIMPKLRTYFQFQQWKATTIDTLNLNEAFKKIVIVRREIYYKKHLQIWKHAFQLVQQFESYSTNPDQVYYKRAFNGLVLYMEKLHLYAQATKLIAANRLEYLQHSFLIYWFKKLKFTRYTNLFRRKRTIDLKHKYFDDWFGRYHNINLNRRQLSTFSYVHKRITYEKAFYRWYDKYYYKQNDRDNEEQIKENHNMKLIRYCFSKLTSEYNLKIYLEDAEAKLLDSIDFIKMKSYFSRWVSNKDSHHVYMFHLNEAIEEIELGKIGRIFDHWKTKYVVESSATKQVINVGNRLQESSLRRKFYNWYCEYMTHSANRDNYDRSRRFRILCLELKAFSSFKAYTKQKKVDNQNIDLIVQKHSSAIISIYLKRWKARAIKIHRRVYLIKSVISQWATNVQQRQFSKWRLYIRIKNTKRIQYHEAIVEYNQKRFEMYLQGFIRGAHRVIPTPDPFYGYLDSFDDYHEENVVTSIYHDLIPVLSPKLKEPRVPSFLNPNQK